MIFYEYFRIPTIFPSISFPFAPIAFFSSLVTRPSCFASSYYVFSASDSSGSRTDSSNVYLRAAYFERGGDRNGRTEEGQRKEKKEYLTRKRVFLLISRTGERKRTSLGKGEKKMEKKRRIRLLENKGGNSMEVESKQGQSRRYPPMLS